MRSAFTLVKEGNLIPPNLLNPVTNEETPLPLILAIDFKASPRLLIFLGVFSWLSCLFKKLTCERAFSVLLPREPKAVEIPFTCLPTLLTTSIAIFIDFETSHVAIFSYLF